MGEDTSTSLEAFGPAPFSLASPGDCILKSSDGIKYKVWRNILSLSSPVFSDMFDLPQGESAPIEHPVIDISESSDVLQTLLLLLYPATTPQIRSYKLAFELISAYDKYIINVESLRPHLASNLMSESAFKTSPLAVYALAWRLGLKEEAKQASRHLHSKVNIQNKDVQNDLLTRTRDVNALVALWDLRQRREVALDAFIEGLPLETYRCPNHHGLTATETTRLRAKARDALAASNPSSMEVIQALALKDVFIIPPAIDAVKRVDASAFGRSSFLNPLPQNRASLAPCSECKNAMTYSTADVVNMRMRQVETAVKAFPQTINWPAA